MSVAVGGTVVVSEYFSRRRLHASLVLDNSYYWGLRLLFIKLVGRTGVGGGSRGGGYPFFLRTNSAYLHFSSIVAPATTHLFQMGQN
jgi:hypothetical protein